MSLSVAFFAVVFLWLQVFATSVPPASNVSLECGNFQNTVRWEYKDFTPGLKFKVDYLQTAGQPSKPGPLLVDAPNLQADVSFLSDPIHEYYVTVTAIVGNDNSDAMPPEGIIFTYLQHSPAKIKCSLDFPHVELVEQDRSKLGISFQHPWLFYNESLPPDLKSRVKEEIPVFTYDVIYEDSDYPFKCDEEVCKGEVSVNGSQKEHCVNISGLLELMAVRGTQEYCTTPVPNPGNSTTIIAVVSALVVFVIVAVLFMVTWKLTQPSHSVRPRILHGGANGSPEDGLAPLTEVDIDVPQVSAASSPKSTQSTVQFPTAEEPSPDQSAGRLRIRVSNGHGLVPNVDEEEHQPNDVEDEQGQPDFSPGYSQKRNMEELLKDCGSFDELEPGELVETYHDANDAARK